MKINKLKGTLISVVLIIILCVIVFLIGTNIGTSLWDKKEPEPRKIELHNEQFKYIAELSTVESYYHNVTKIYDENYKEWLWFDKPLNFWVNSEYIVTYGIDADLIEFSIEDNIVSVTIPEARVLKSKNNYAENNTYVAKDSVDVGHDELTVAYKEIEKEIIASAETNTILLEKAQHQAKQLMANYINKVGTINNVEYEIKWIEVDQKGKPIT